ncbi:MAG: hypothetical protein GY822_29570 [Deltaproteobacteria bacterium]|nr:hypothetical protein [Deltaproteobacteria bacterium]
MKHTNQSSAFSRHFLSLQFGAMISILFCGCSSIHKVSVVKDVKAIDLRVQKGERERRIQLCQHQAVLWRDQYARHDQQAKALMGAGTGMVLRGGISVVTAAQFASTFQVLHPRPHPKGMQQGVFFSAMTLATLGTSLAATGAVVALFGVVQRPDDEENAVFDQMQNLQIDMASFLLREKDVLQEDFQMRQRSFLLADKICAQTPTRALHDVDESLQQIGRWQNELQRLDRVLVDLNVAGHSDEWVRKARMSHACFRTWALC